MKIIFFGTPNFVLPIPQALLEAGFEIAAVVTRVDKPVGRKQVLTPSPVKLWAQKHQIPILAPSKFDDNFRFSILDFSSDIGILTAYGQIIPQGIIDLFPKGMLVVHPSLLPKYRGASPVQASILAGDKETGVSIIKMDAEMDHGPIVAQLTEDIKPDDTPASLYDRLFKKSAESLVSILPDYLEGKIKLCEQDHSQATYTKILKKEDGYFSIDNPPPQDQLERSIRAYHPWPNVWTRWQGKIIKFYPEKMIQMEGKKPVKLKDFLNGYPNFPFKSLLHIFFA
ncbi:MAG: methionyl-tRNA formyltransferase [bacterium]|nr:methionyl-tRNA formyltransferase [bacterium]